MKKAKLFTQKKTFTAKKFVSKFRKETQNLYSTKEWTNYRFRFLHHNPKCYACGESSSVVDHIYPHKGDIVLFEKNTNHIPLCTSHHNFVTAKFDREMTPDTVSKLQWLAKEREERGITLKVKVIPYKK